MTYHSYDDIPLVLTVDEVADILRVGRNTAYRLVHEGKIYSYTIQRKIYVPRHALDKYLFEFA